MHGILIISKADVFVETRHCLVSAPGGATGTQESDSSNKTIVQTRLQNQGKGTISAIVGSYKSAVTKSARNIHGNFAWQTRFHDHVIRNSKSFDTIQNYIVNNAANWESDKFY
jgi:putative transposase